MQLIDIGANLTHESFKHDFDGVVTAARGAGLAHIILTGTDLETSQAALAHAQENDYFSSTAGFHPHVATDCDSAAMDKIAALARSSQVVAIGETGLDFNRNYSPQTTQQDVFEQHLKLAEALQLPMFLHQRDAHKPFLELLKSYRDRIPGGVVHCFTDTAEALRDYLDLDMYIGITGWICDERRGKALQQIVRDIPDDRLLIETDAPYLLPRTLKPKPASRRNEPRYLVEVLRTIALCRDSDVNLLARQTSANTQRLFGNRVAPHSLPDMTG